MAKHASLSVDRVGLPVPEHRKTGGNESKSFYRRRRQPPRHLHREVAPPMPRILQVQAVAFSLYGRRAIFLALMAIK